MTVNIYCEELLIFNDGVADSHHILSRNVMDDGFEYSTSIFIFLFFFSEYLKKLSFTNDGYSIHIE